MNALQKRNLMEYAAEESKCQPSKIIYVMIKDGMGRTTSLAEVAKSLQNQGFRCYAKMRDGGLIL